MKKLKIGIIIFFCILLTGCWNYRELNTMAIVGAIGIDYNEKDNLFEVSVQIFNAKKSSTENQGSPSQSSPITFYEESAKTIHEALRNVIQESPKKLYIGHLQLLLLGESLVKENMLDVLDFFFRDPESRKDFIVLSTTDCSASEILQVLTPLETIPSQSIYMTLVANSSFKGSTVPISFDEVMSAIYSEGKEVILPTILLEGSPETGNESVGKKPNPKTKVFLIGSTLFKDNKAIGYLDGEDTFGYNFIARKVKSSIVSFKCDDEGNYATLEIIKAGSKAKYTYKNSIATGQVKIEGNAVISEVNCSLELKDPKVLLKLQDLANKEVEKIVNNAVSNIIKNFKTDVLGVGNCIYKNQYKEWQNIKDKWDKIYPNTVIEVKSKIVVKNKGASTNSSKEG